MSIIEAAVRSHVGRVRRNNEDNFYFQGETMPLQTINQGAAFSCVSKKPYQLYAICDGMGGEAAGEKASTTAAMMLSELEALASGDPEVFLRVIRHINEAVCKLRDEEFGRRVGCTMAFAAIHEDSLRLLHVGDSRIYRYAQSALTQMTTDHTEAQWMIRMGIASPTDDSRKGRANALTQHLGIRPDEAMIQPDLSNEIKLQPDEYWMICSDGLTDLVDAESIAECFSQDGGADAICDRLVKTALKAGGWDNVTVIVFRALLNPNGSAQETLTTRLLWDDSIEKTLDPKAHDGRSSAPSMQHSNETKASRKTDFRLPWFILLGVLSLCLVFMLGMWTGTTLVKNGDGTPMPSTFATIGEFSQTSEASTTSIAELATDSTPEMAPLATIPLMTPAPTAPFSASLGSPLNNGGLIAAPFTPWNMEMTTSPATAVSPEVGMIQKTRLLNPAEPRPNLDITLR